MRPVLFVWRGVTVYSYPAMLYLGMVLGIVAGNYASNAAGLDSAHVYIAMVLLIIPGLLGARLTFVATNWQHYRREPARIWRRSEGGGSMLGGLPLMVLVSVPLLAALRVPFASFWDVATFVLLVGMLFTRLGCLLNGCCAGRPSDGWCALHLPNYRGVWRRRVPSQMLEALLTALLLFAAVLIWGRNPFPGAVFLFTVAGYSGGRLLLEPMRDEQDRIGSLNVQLTFSAAFVALALAGLIGGLLISG